MERYTWHSEARGLQGITACRVAGRCNFVDGAQPLLMVQGIQLYVSGAMVSAGFQTTSRDWRELQLFDKWTFSMCVFGNGIQVITSSEYMFPHEYPCQRVILEAFGMRL